MTRRPPRSPLFPYPTLFRSSKGCRPFYPARASAAQRCASASASRSVTRSEEHTSELQSPSNLTFTLFFNDPAPPEISPLPLPDALPIFQGLPPLLPRSRVSGATLRIRLCFSIGDEIGRAHVRTPITIKSYIYSFF